MPASRGHCENPRRKGAPEPWVNGSPRWIDFQQESAIDANAACRGGKQ
jgi:hypothetical protein